MAKATITPYHKDLTTINGATDFAKVVPEYTYSSGAPLHSGKGSRVASASSGYSYVAANNTRGKTTVSKETAFETILKVIGAMEDGTLEKMSYKELAREHYENLKEILKDEKPEAKSVYESSVRVQTRDSGIPPTVSVTGSPWWPLAGTTVYIDEATGVDRTTVTSKGGWSTVVWKERLVQHVHSPEVTTACT